MLTSSFQELIHHYALFATIDATTCFPSWEVVRNHIFVSYRMLDSEVVQEDIVEPSGQCYVHIDF